MDDPERIREGKTVRLVLYAADVGEAANFREAFDGEDAVDVPVGQHERWKAAQAAWGAAQKEINALAEPSA